MNRNKRGGLVFDLTPAKTLLRGDVAQKKHEEMTPQQLKASRPEYHQFSPDKFRQRIYQEVRRQNYVNYLELKGQEKARKAREARKKPKQHRKLTNVSESICHKSISDSISLESITPNQSNAFFSTISDARCDLSLRRGVENVSKQMPPCLQHLPSNVLESTFSIIACLVRHILF